MKDDLQALQVSHQYCWPCMPGRLAARQKREQAASVSDFALDVWPSAVGPASCRFHVVAVGLRCYIVVLPGLKR